MPAPETVMDGKKFLETYPGETAHSFHDVLEHHEYDIEDLREQVAGFYDEFVESQDVITSATSSRYIKKGFEKYLESGEFGRPQKIEAVDELIDEAESFELDYY